MILKVKTSAVIPNVVANLVGDISQTRSRI